MGYMVIPTEQKTLPIDRVVRQKPDKPQRKKTKQRGVREHDIHNI